MAKQLIRRIQEQSLYTALEQRRVVLLTGPRQCGKTTLSKHLKLENSAYFSLDDATFLQAAIQDPQGFVISHRRTTIIDEIQRAPTLLTAIKMIVDNNTEYGQFLLTGSANLNALPSVQESLAGRVKKIRLRTLTQTEIEGNQGDFLKNAFEQTFATPAIAKSKADILKYCFRGGYPEVLNLSQRQRQSWHEDYVQALLERDLRDVAKIRNVGAMYELVKVLCSWTGKFINMNELASHLSINYLSLDTYIRALEALFIVERLEPWMKIDYQRIGRRPKFFINDTGLVCSLLRWQQDQILFDSDRSGKIVETFVFNELATLIDRSNGEYGLYHYRDREGREIDFLIERDDGAMLGIEVKAGSSVGMGDFKHLVWMQKLLHNQRPFIGIILYTGQYVLPFGKNFWAVPMASIWHVTE